MDLLRPLIIVVALSLAGCSTNDTKPAAASADDQPDHPPLPPDIEKYVSATASVGQMGAREDFEVPKGLHVLLEANASWSKPSQLFSFTLRSETSTITEQVPILPTTFLEIKQRLDPGTYTLSIVATGTTADERVDMKGTFFEVVPRQTSPEAQ